MKIAMTDLDIIWEDKSKNKIQCEKMIKGASEEQADCILFPEMTLTGFSLNLSDICMKDDEDISFFSNMALKYQIGIGFGYVTMEHEKGCNHFAFVDKKGNMVNDYVKIHPFTYGGEHKCYVAGEKICHFSFEQMTCGSFICYDLRFGEAFWKLPENTDVIFLIANWPASRLDHWYTLLKARAIELQCYVIGVNRVGEGNHIQYEKSSVGFSPSGERLAENKKKWNRYVEIEQEKRLQYIQEFPTRKDHRPDLYFE